MSTDEEKGVVDEMLSDKTATLDALAREELGIDPTELGGSGYQAALASFMLFALGAIVPIVPFMIAGGSAAVIASIGLSGIGLFAIGAAITIFSRGAVPRSRDRKTALGPGRARVNFFICPALGAPPT